MGNCFAPCKSSMGFCFKDVAEKHRNVLQIVKMDGKVLEFRAPVLVKDILVNFSGSAGVGVSKESSEHLPPNYELKIGKIYYMLPPASTTSADVSSAPDTEKGSTGVRIKIVITKQQLQELLAKQISVEEVLSGLEKTSLCCSVDSPTNWKPKLESIPEGCE